MAPRVCHYGPITAIILITLITCSASYGAYQLWCLPAHVVYYFRTVHFVTMYTWLILIAKNFIQAMYTTGFVPANWSPVSCVLFSYYGNYRNRTINWMKSFYNIVTLVSRGRYHDRITALSVVGMSLIM